MDSHLFFTVVQMWCEFAIAAHLLPLMLQDARIRQDSRSTEIWHILLSTLPANYLYSCKLSPKDQELELFFC